MPEFTASMAWENLWQAITALEVPGGDWNIKLATMEAGVEIMLDFSPEEVVAQAEASDLPTRAVVSWLVFEAHRLEGIDPVKGEKLRAYWDARVPEDQKAMNSPAGLKLF
jgi:hypothetical protein